MTFGANEAPLRKDGRQWLIYDEHSVEAAVRALETIALGMIGQHFKDHPDMSIRGIANAMLKLGKARLEAGLGLIRDVETSDELREATRCAGIVFGFLAGEQEELPVGEADQLYAALFFLDQKLNSAGISGPGRFRELARGDL